MRHQRTALKLFLEPALCAAAARITASSASQSGFQFPPPFASPQGESGTLQADDCFTFRASRFAPLTP